MTTAQRSFVEKVVDGRTKADREDWAWALDLKKNLHGAKHPTWHAGLGAEEIEAVKTGRAPL